MIQGPRLIFWSFFLSGFLAGVSVWCIITNMGETPKQGMGALFILEDPGGRREVDFGVSNLCICGFSWFFSPDPFLF